MNNLKILIALVLISLLQGCHAFSYGSASLGAENPKLLTLYDYQLRNKNFEVIDEVELISLLQTSDVVFIGEYHANHASHLLQSRVLSALHLTNQKMNRPTVLSTEMFNRDQQDILDQYLNSEIGERYLMQKAPAWDNYRGSYRPLIEYAKGNNVPVIAANAAADVIRCIGQQGEKYPEKLPSEQRSWIAAKPFSDVPAYEEKFIKVMTGGHDVSGPRVRNSYLAQLARDNTMAESIAIALEKYPGSQVIHLNGAFHSTDHLGTAGALKIMKPKLTISVITPIHVSEFQRASKEELSTKKDDAYYLLTAQPEDFVQENNRNEYFKSLFSKSREKAKNCL